MKNITLLIVLCISMLTITACSLGGSLTPTSPETYKLQVINDSSYTVCYLYISPVASEEWGEDWLESNTIDSGEDFIFDVEPGVYDLRADDCNNEILATAEDVDLSTEDRSWTLSDIE